MTESLRGYCFIIEKEHVLWTRWVTASNAVGAIEPFLVVYIQGLGHLDCCLIEKDEWILAKREEEPQSIELALDFTYHYTLSALWVMGAYETVRTLDERLKDNQKVKELKHQFERIRIPLAKLEASVRFSKSDQKIAYPVFTKSGAAWMLNERTIITRRELSDSFLSTLESMKDKRSPSEIRNPKNTS
jgi:hypothetical protein